MAKKPLKLHKSAGSVSPSRAEWPLCWVKKGTYYNTAYQLVDWSRVDCKTCLKYKPLEVKTNDRTN